MSKKGKGEVHWLTGLNIWTMGGLAIIFAGVTLITADQEFSVENLGKLIQQNFIFPTTGFTITVLGLFLTITQDTQAKLHKRIAGTITVIIALLVLIIVASMPNEQHKIDDFSAWIIGISLVAYLAAALWRLGQIRNSQTAAGGSHDGDLNEPQITIIRSGTNEMGHRQ